MKRFYKIAESGTAPGGHVVRLDGKVVKTPMHHPLIVASAPLAAAMAAEWAAQDGNIIPVSMPLTQFASTMIDKTRGRDRREMTQQVINYGAADMLCYFADRPADLVARQEKHWRPLLAWMEKTEGIALETVSGIQYHHQPKEALNKIAVCIEKLDDIDFTVVQAVTGVTGSVVIALALAHGFIDADAAHKAACVDELYQLETWGADTLAQQRLDNIRNELEVAVRFRDLARQS